MESVREMIEREERETLSPHACRSAQSAGREHAQEPCTIRTDFQRDRDRILHCKSFRRLMHKTQVFLSPEGDHYRTRLTHTLEVSQIARTIARALRLNEDLTEAIALGHDLGHTPFGHTGEDALRAICVHGFVHAQQSVRVVEKLENEGQGLNLCAEVRDGILHHSSGVPAATWEGRVVRYADKIAYMCHDIEDASRAGVLDADAVPRELRELLGETKSQRISTMIASLIAGSSTDVCMEEPIQAAYTALNRFMFEAVYSNPLAKGECDKALEVVKLLFNHFVANPEKLPEKYQRIANDAGLQRAVSDYISGMSDRYAINAFENLFIPRSWDV